MDKIIKRTEYVKKYALRRTNIKRAAKTKRRLGEYKEQSRNAAADRQKQIEAYRIARREDWLLGPLAPRRDAGKGAETHGTLSQTFIKGPANPGKRKEWCIERGDRVVITGENERDRGKIGMVKELRKKEEEVIIDKLNLVRRPSAIFLGHIQEPTALLAKSSCYSRVEMARLTAEQCDVAVPPHLLVNDPDKTPFRRMEFPVPLSSVRLVYRIADPETGITQDTIIEYACPSSTPSLTIPI